jgi:ribosomal protein L24
MILAGKDKGKSGEVSDVIRSKNHIYVKAMNTVSTVVYVYGVLQRKVTSNRPL